MEVYKISSDIIFVNNISLQICIFGTTLLKDMDHRRFFEILGCCK